ncbi:MAG: hypothetical protein ACTSQ0_01225 [Candidatus Heimdallarchaeota archaeon]
MRPLVRKSLIVFFIASVFVLSQTYSIVDKVLGQTNLIEEDDKFTIFAGNLYELAIPKNQGPSAFFDFGSFGQIELKFNYISEYESSSVFMNSLNNLYGKGYSLEHIDWDMLGTSDAYKSSVNFSKANLDRNASLDLSLSIFNQNSTVNSYNIESLSQSFIEFNLTNWDFSAGSRGIAINIQTLLTDSDDYARLGPYMDFNSGYYFVKIIRGDCAFNIKFKPQVIIKTQSGVEEFYESMFFANYNIAAQETKPADFWISVPFRYDISQIIFSFLCFCEITTENGGFEWFSLSVIVLSAICTISIIKKRRKENLR